MTAGSGICHSEVSTATTSVLHGVQLWIALPDRWRDVPRGFEHHVPPVVDVGGAQVRVFLGSLAGQTSPVATFSPLLGAEVVLEAQTRLTLSVETAFEHGVLVDVGRVHVLDTELAATELGYLAPGAQSLTLSNTGDSPARVLLLGGTPFDDEIVMWWNFVGRSHEEIAAFRDDWEGFTSRFGSVEGFEGPIMRLPAPELPHVRMRPRRHPAR
jgi:redox-sensitive bicupin YhaK (pirin superfamily)